MGEREIGEAGFAELFLHPGLGRNARLERIAGLIDWDRLEVLLGPVRSRLGRKGYPALALFRALLLQQWYGLSDPGLEEALLDRLSFRRFCGFGPMDATPDETTFVRFRAALAERDLGAALFEEVGHQLEARGLVLKRGTLIDASLVEAQVARPGRPPAAPAGALSARDPDARWTRRGGKSHFGYKAHLAVDQGSGLVRAALLTGASVNDGEATEALLRGDEAAVYADKAYESLTQKFTRRSIILRGGG